MNDVIRIAAPAPKPPSDTPDPAKLRKLKEGLMRNATATVRHATTTAQLIDQILAELEEREAA